MASAEIRVLGPVEVGELGRIIGLTPKQRSLLAALVVADGAARTVDELVEALWARHPPSSAGKLVRVYVSQLRKVLPCDLCIRTKAAGYVLDVPRDAIDANRFERFVAESTAAGAAGNHALAVSLATQALGLWRGRAYGDLEYEDSVRGQAERLEELRVVAVQVRFAAELELGRHAEILGDIVAVARGHQLDERLQWLAMLALYRCGRQAEALDHYEAVRRHLADELGLDPGADLRELQRRILTHDPALHAPAAASASCTSVLPSLPTSLVGREPELAALATLLSGKQTRLLVLTGAGGTGKTRLALEAARRSAGSFANGTALVELAALRDPELVPAAVAQALDVAETPDEPLEATIARAVSSLELLLIIDNAEHLREAAPLFTSLVKRAPRLTVLVTSRAVLHISGESVFPVEPLRARDAVDLLVQRARQLAPAFSVSQENEADLVEICRRLDGLPLAIELAAARLRTLTPRLLLERLGQKLSLLSFGPRDLPARQRTLEATIEWSVELLGERERRALARLSVFRGGARLEAAEAVCETDLDVLTTLVDHSLVQRSVERGRVRLSLLETINEYAAEQLATSPDDLDATRRRHAGWCRALAEEAEPHLSQDGQTDWLHALDIERENLRAALDHLREEGLGAEQLALAVQLSRFWYIRGYLRDGRRMFEEALETAVALPADDRRRALTAAASLAHLQGDHETATHFAERALAAARDDGEPRFVANALSNLGAITLAAGNQARSALLLEEAVARAREAGDERILALAVNNLGDLLLTVGDYERAAPLFDESLSLLQARGDTANIARSLFNNGAVELMCGAITSARGRFLQSLELCRTTGDREDTAWSLVGLAATEVATGDAARGALLLGAARAVLTSMGADFKPFERQLDELTEQRSREALGETQHEAALDAGGSMTLAEALRQALQGG